MIALWANGYRPSRNAPGHHQTMIQSLVHSVGLERERIFLLDTLRVKRNAIDYTGDDVDEAIGRCLYRSRGRASDARVGLSGATKAGAGSVRFGTFPGQRPGRAQTPCLLLTFLQHVLDCRTYIFIGARHATTARIHFANAGQCCGG